jgi:N-methylhydantoinase A
MATTGGWVVAADIGGTFTDVALAGPTGDLVTAKVLTTPEDPTDALVAGIAQVLGDAAVSPTDVDRVIHATTLATNVILERRGPPIAFVTTQGFKDLFLLGRQARVEEERFDLDFVPAAPPVPETHVIEVSERIGPRGEVIVPLDPGSLDAAVDRVAALGAPAVAICLLHSYVNSDHEDAVAAACRERLGDHVAVVTSSSVAPEIREYERSTTAVMSAYVSPVMAGYLGHLERRLTALGIDAPVHIIDSIGGAMSVELAIRRAVATVESGPAAGVLTAQQLGTALGWPNVISFDMGGTTAKAGAIRDGRADVTHRFHVGGKGSYGGRRAGTGVPISVPSIDLAEVGSGGGSIAWIDAGGALRVGSRSAGAHPGPACYGLGGSEPTVTDADLLLGLLGERLAGGMILDRAAAEQAMQSIAAPLGASVLETAVAVHEIVNAAMGAAIHVVTVQRGIDPRDFALVAFGGAGPAHAATVAAQFGIDTVIVPAGAGVGSALGLLCSELATQRSRTVLAPAASADPALLESVLDGLTSGAAADLGIDCDDPDVVVERTAAVRYIGQASDLTVALPASPLDQAAVNEVVNRFYAAYRDAFTIDVRDPVELVTLRVRVRRAGRSPALTGPAGRNGTAPPTSHRQVHFASFGGLVTTPVVTRVEVGSENLFTTGPLLIEDDESTVVVPPGWHVERVEGETLMLRRPPR